jgi:hypothetical protein
VGPRKNSVDGAGFFAPAGLTENLFLGSLRGDFDVDYLHALVVALSAPLFWPIAHHNNVFLVHGNLLFKVQIRISTLSKNLEKIKGFRIASAKIIDLRLFSLLAI